MGNRCADACAAWGESLRDHNTRRSRTPCFSYTVFALIMISGCRCWGCRLSTPILNFTYLTEARAFWRMEISRSRERRKVQYSRNSLHQNLLSVPHNHTIKKRRRQPAGHSQREASRRQVKMMDPQQLLAFEHGSVPRPPQLHSSMNNSTLDPGDREAPRRGRKEVAPPPSR